MKAKILASATALVALTGCQYSVQFSGTGSGRADRIEIPVDPPTPVDVGSGDFTIEWWMQSTVDDNTTGTPTCGAGVYGWRTGHTIVDRDRAPISGADGRDFGVSISSGGDIAFGVQNASGTAYTACTSLFGDGVLDGLWHHVAVQRSSAGTLQVWVDGELAASGAGPSGDISYPDGVAGARATDPYLVIGAEKRDEGAGFPSYAGLVEEIRISTVLRYDATFTRPTEPFATDASTVGLYHLDETGAVAANGAYAVNDSSGAAGGPTNGSLRVTSDGSAPMRGVAESPFIVDEL